MDFKGDESYTPNKVSIRAGTAIHDLREVRVMELEEPCGCIRVPLGEEAGATAEEAQLTVQACPIQAFFVQIAVLSNHQNGRDTHLRLVRVFGPRSADPQLALLGMPCAIRSPEMSMFATVR